MTNSQHLIELLEDTLHEWECDASIKTLTEIAEQLIENGVIVPPCKVGDMVYYPWIYDDNKGIAFTEVENIKIYVNGIPLVFVKDLGSDMPIPTAFYPENFGETVFLTYEEAERKLKERESNA